MLFVEPRIHRYERSRQRPFAEEVAEGVGNAQRGPKRVGSRAVAEVMGEHTLAHVSQHASDQDPGRYTGGVSSASTGHF